VVSCGVTTRLLLLLLLSSQATACAGAPCVWCIQEACGGNTVAHWSKGGKMRKASTIKSEQMHILSRRNPTCQSQPFHCAAHERLIAIKICGCEDLEQSTSLPPIQAPEQRLELPPPLRARDV
jgi:hypothetical protein